MTEPYIETTDDATYRVRAVKTSSNDSESPRTFDGNVGVLVAKHRTYALPFEGDLASQIHDGLTDRGFRVVARWLTMAHGARVVLPVFSYEHGDMKLEAGRHTVPPEDHRCVGLIYDTPATRAALGDPTDAEITATLTREVELYDRWRTDDLYEYVVEQLIGTDQADPQAWLRLDELGQYYSPEAALEAGKEVLLAAGLVPDPQQDERPA